MFGNGAKVDKFVWISDSSKSTCLIIEVKKNTAERFHPTSFYVRFYGRNRRTNLTYPVFIALRDIYKG